MNAQRTRPWALLFFISLAINLFLAGMMTARWVHRPGGFEGLGPGRGLPPESQQIARRVMSQHRPAMQERMRAVRDARMRAIEALSADPFDPARASSALAELRQKATAVDEELSAAALELAPALPPKQRAQFARNFAPGGARGRMHPRWGIGPHPPDSGLHSAPSAPVPPAP